jgi:Ca2+-binding RTX toxin-like protein
MSKVTITTDSDQSIDANTANTTYVINQFVDIVPAALYATAIDATGKAANRTFEIAGHLGGYRGIQVGDDNTTVAGGHVVINATGLIDAGYVGVALNSDDGSIVNHGTIDNCIHGIVARGDNLTITNTGTINAEITSVDFGGKNAEMWNSGTISSSIAGVFMHGGANDTVTLHNSGTASGGINAAAENDVIDNSGMLTGDIFLNDGDDRYDGKGGTINGACYGEGGNDILKGGSQTEILSGGTGHDIMTGRGGADVFIFSTGFDADTITDFQASGGGHDSIDLSAMTGFGAFGDLKHHIQQDGTDAVLDFGHGDVLTLHNVDMHDLTAQDFLF